MTPQLIGGLSVLVLMFLILARFPLGTAMGIVGLGGYAAISNWDKALTVLGTVPLSLAGYSFSVLPMFILMGTVAANSGMARELFIAANAVFAGRKGALAMATVGGCAGFGAVSGSSFATAATFTRMAVPEMQRYGYDLRIATGSVAAGGTLGILIPPSVILVIYGLLAEESVPELFAAGLVPGILLTFLFVVVVWLVGVFKPDWTVRSPKMAMRERLVAAIAMWKIAVLFGLAVGGIYAGIFSPTEAAAVASFGAIVIAVGTGALGWRGVWHCIMETLRTTAMLMFIILGAWVFARFVVLTKLPDGLINIIQDVGIGPTGAMIAIIIFYIILGCFLEAVTIVLVTVPVFLPVIISLGFDPVWYGVLMVVVVEVGLITPPVGLNLFVIRGQLPEIPLGDIFKGVVPFLGADLVLIALLMLFPQLALWLPRIMLG